MKIAFPSREFDEAVAAVCHGSVSDEEARALNELLGSDGAARDEYILRLELHSRLASEPDLFVPATGTGSGCCAWRLRATGRSSSPLWASTVSERFSAP